MSRVGKKPVTIPGGVKVSIQNRVLSVQGPKGKLDFAVHPRIKMSTSEKEISFERPTNIGTDRALHGTMRSLAQNMIQGVTEGYSKTLDIEGVGYKAQVKGKVLNLSLGFTHPIDYDIPAGIEVKCVTPTRIMISGIDKQLVGQVAAEVRGYHKPEPYKGKGIRYTDEVVRRKQGKTVG